MPDHTDSQLKNSSPIWESEFRRKPIWLIAIRWVVAILVAIALGYTLLTSSKQIADLEFSFRAIDPKFLGLACAAYIAAMGLSCVFWRSALLALNCRPTWKKTMFAFFASQLGKYVPGKALVVLIRTDIVRGEQTPTASAAASVFVETLTWIFVGSVIASVLIFFQFGDQVVLKWTAAGMALVAGILTIPSIFKMIASTLTKFAPGTFNGLTIQTMALGWIVLTIGWCLNAFSLLAVLLSLPNTEVGVFDFPLLLACVTLSTVAGFASLLPGGLGVRELVMIPLLGPRFGIGIAIVAAILIRLIWISAELLSSGIIYLMLRFEAGSQANE